MIRIILFIPVFAILIVSSCSWNQYTPSQAESIDPVINPASPDIIDDVFKLYKEKQYELALTALLESSPKHLEAPRTRKLLWSINDRLVTVQWHLQKGSAELLKNNLAAAEENIDIALKIYPDHRPSLLLKQQLRVMMAAQSPSEQKILKTVKKKPVPVKRPSEEDIKLADYYLKKGNIFFEKGQLEEAKDSWVMGFDIAPSYEPIRENLVKLFTNEGLQLFGQGDIKAAIEKWENALKLHPGDPEIKGYLDTARKAHNKVNSIN